MAKSEASQTTLENRSGSGSASIAASPESPHDNRLDCNSYFGLIAYLTNTHVIVNDTKWDHILIEKRQSQFRISSLHWAIG
ncbi:uncharacterized protein PHALS_06189 [Plasmopara halstedii]|uniref:Uncharacterized protein n=1 Tax=Plasmopara halstedii TaxID=4781 RepID=A0A0N7L7Y4_PLAHL|nr:uncharacterized protein PHALS_06189 [Plasmopara halstedii]CEG48363.1 hypothetical protein PHALS_06189 [Plasmopara halstedii]|eukprot:XP_024584732.1 hypothetical protein PHALS_06189 [Plasmopara halstedii]